MSATRPGASSPAGADGHAPGPAASAAAAASASAAALAAAKPPPRQTQDQDETPGDESGPPPPPFEPPFTLLTNATTSGTIHPRVRYIFSDDDASVLSAAAAAAAAAGPDAGSHRPVLVDLAPSSDGSSWTVAWASSLTPDFALTASCLEPAPQQQHEADASSSAAPGGVLRLEGVVREPVEAGPESLPGSASESGAVGREDVDALADEFRRRMGVLRRVVCEAERRRDVVRRQQQPRRPDGDEPDESTQDAEAGPAVETK